MLKLLRIQNFKGWKDTGDIRLAPISLFFGANSSGKSSIGQFLMMLKQTVESPDRKAVFYPGGKNSAVQLGSYREMVFFDRSDRKFVAVANAHPAKPPILQSTDSKWWGWKDALHEVGITVHFLCPEYVQTLYAEKIEP